MSFSPTYHHSETLDDGRYRKPSRCSDINLTALRRSETLSIVVPRSGTQLTALPCDHPGSCQEYREFI